MRSQEHRDAGPAGVGKMNWREKVIFGAAALNGHDFERITAPRLFIQDEPTDSLRRFEAIYDHARQHVPYYRKKYGDAPAGTAPGSVADISHVPFITKEEIACHGVMSRGGTPVAVLESGGTTGRKIQTRLDKDYLLARYGSLLSILYSLGWSMGDPIVALHPLEYTVSRYWKKKEFGKFFFEAFQQGVLYRLLHNRVNAYYGGEAFSNPASLDFKEQIRRRRPRLLITRPDILLAWLKQLTADGETIPRVPTILCVGNVFTASVKAFIETAMRGVCYNMYASTEMGYVGLSCAHSREWVHVDENNYWVELDGSGPGEVVITDFRNHVMPLIRYRTGDAGLVRQAACPCGKTGKLLKIVGRMDRFLTDMNNERIYESQVVDQFLDIKGVRGLQIMSGHAGKSSVSWRTDPLTAREEEHLLNVLESALKMTQGTLCLERQEAFRISDSGKFSYIVPAVFGK